MSRRISKSVAEEVHLRAGTPVEFHAGNGVLTRRTNRRREYTLSQLLANAKGPSPYRRLDRVGPVGRELL